MGYKNFLPFPGDQLNSAIPRPVDGIVLTKWNRDRSAYHVSARACHITGSLHNNPLIVRPFDTPVVSPLGLSIPCARLKVETQAGSGKITGNIQLAVRKYRSADGKASDICPVWPATDGVEATGDTEVTPVDQPADGSVFPTANGDIELDPDSEYAVSFPNTYDTSKLKSLTVIMYVDSDSAPGEGSVDFSVVQKAETFDIASEIYGDDVAGSRKTIGEDEIAFRASTDPAVDYNTPATFSKFKKVITFNNVRLEGTAGITGHYIRIKNNGIANLKIAVSSVSPVAETVPQSTGDVGGAALEVTLNGVKFSRLDFGMAKPVYVNGDGSSFAYQAIRYQKNLSTGQTTGPVGISRYVVHVAGAPGWANTWLIEDEIFGFHTIVTVSGVEVLANPYKTTNVLYYITRSGGTVSVTKIAVNGTKTTYTVTSGASSDPRFFKRLYNSDATQVVLIGDTVYKSTNSGATWSALSATVPSGTIMDMDMDLNGDVYLAIDNDGLYKFTGGAWVLQSSGLPAGLRAASIGVNRSNGKLLAVGTVDGKVYTFNEGGGSWSLKYEFSELSSPKSVYRMGTFLFGGTNKFHAYINNDVFLLDDAYSTTVRLRGARKASGDVLATSTAGDCIAARNVATTSSTAMFSSPYGTYGFPKTEKYQFRGSSGTAEFTGSFRRDLPVSGSWAKLMAGISISNYQQKITESSAPPSSINTPDMDRFSTFYAKMTAASLRITNLAAFWADGLFEDFDTLQVCMTSDVFNGSWKVIASVTDNVGLVIVDFDMDSSEVKNATEIVPLTNWPFSGHRKMILGTFGLNQNLIAFGQPGFDPYREGPLVEKAGISYLTRDVESEENAWVLGRLVADVWENGIEGVTPSSALDNLRVRIFKGDPSVYLDTGDRHIPTGGQEVAIARAFYRQADDVIEIRDIRGVGLSNLTNGQPHTDDNGTGTGYWIEFRRGVVATVNKGSDEIILSYEDDNSPAYIANNWMLYHTAVVEGIQSEAEEIIRVEPLTDPRSDTPFPTQHYFPSNRLRLLNGWSSESGTGLVTLIANNTRLFIGHSTADQFEGTSFKLRLDTVATRAIRAIGVCKGVLFAVCSADEVLVFASNGIFEPLSFNDIIRYDVSQDIQVEIRRYQHTCVSDSIANDSYGNAYWRGGGGKVYRFDLNSVTSITNDIFEEAIKNQDQTEGDRIQLVGLSGHSFSPAIHVCGFAKKATLKGGGRVHELRTATLKRYETNEAPESTVTWHEARPLRDQRFAYQPDRESWVDLRGMGEVEAACSVVTEQGEQELLSLANGRLFLYPPNLGLLSNTEQDAFTLGRINRRSLYFSAFPAARITVGATPTITLLASEFPEFERYLPFRNAGMIAAKYSADPEDALNIEYAEIFFATELADGYTTDEAVTLAMGPGWTVEEGKAYNVIIGPRPWQMELPSLYAMGANPNHSLGGIERVNIELDVTTPDASFDWPFYLLIGSTKGQPGYRATGQDTLSERLIGSKRDEMRYDNLFLQGELSYESRIILGGISPPDGNVLVGPIILDYRSGG